jgi:hypothetical protein
MTGGAKAAQPFGRQSAKHRYRMGVLRSVRTAARMQGNVTAFDAALRPAITGLAGSD